MDPTMEMPCSAHTIAGKWESEGLQNAAAASYKWFRNEFAYQENLVAQEKGMSVYDVINEKIEQVDPGCNGLICIPYLAGSAAPHWDPFARGTFIGFTLGHTREDMARAIMEGVTYEAKEIIEKMIANGMEVNEILLNGGGAKGPVWCQIQADMYGKTCTTLDIEEATTLGAAILAALGAGSVSYTHLDVYKRQEFYKGTPHIEAYEAAYRIKNCPICYNGDMFCKEEIENFWKRFPNTDAMMLGRGILRDPCLYEKLFESEEMDASVWKQKVRSFHDALLDAYIDCLLYTSSAIS